MVTSFYNSIYNFFALLLNYESIVPFYASSIGDSARQRDSERLQVPLKILSDTTTTGNNLGLLNGFMFRERGLLKAVNYIRHFVSNNAFPIAGAHKRPDSRC